MSEAALFWSQSICAQASSPSGLFYPSPGTNLALGLVMVKDLVLDGNLGRDVLRHWQIALDPARGRGSIRPLARRHRKLVRWGNNYITPIPIGIPDLRVGTAVERVAMREGPAQAQAMTPANQSTKARALSSARSPFGGIAARRGFGATRETIVTTMVRRIGWLANRMLPHRYPIVSPCCPWLR